MLHDTKVSARDIMVRRVYTASTQDRVFEVTKTLTKRGYSGAPVVDGDNRVLGIITEYDCIRAFLNAVHHERPPSRVEDVMTRDVVTVTEDAGILSLANLMLQKRLHRVPVVRDGKLVGQISRRDVLLRAVAIFEASGNREAAILYLSALDRKPPV